MPPKKEKEISFLQRHEFFLFIISFFVFLILLAFFSNLPILTAESACGDGTLYGTCSVVKPYYCTDGFLIEQASLCGCSEGAIREGDSCTTPLQTEPRETKLYYILDGEERELKFITYGGLTDYLSQLSRVISYENGGKPLRADFKLKNIKKG